jgi:CRISPR-associated protein Csy3
VYDHGQRTTKSHEVIKGAGDTQRSGEDSSNLVNGQQAKIPPHCDSLEVSTSVLVLPLGNEPHQCDKDHWYKAIKHGVDAVKDSEALELLGRYYAYNMANASWLWRNRTVAESIQVKIRFGEHETKIDEALDMSPFPVAPNDGENAADPHTSCRTIDELAKAITAALSGASKPLRVYLVACAKMMPGQAVWPSQRFTPAKRIVGKQPNGKEILSGRDFLMFGGAPAISAEKIGCALRTFDRDHCHPVYTEEVIPVEPNGGSIKVGINLRRAGNDIRSLLPRFISATPASPQRQQALTQKEMIYVLGCLIRGGIFGGTKPSEDVIPAAKPKRTKEAAHG